MHYGVNTWVWVSPLGDADVAALVPKVAEIGFDWIELPIESPGDFDYARAGAIVRDAGLKVSVGAAMAPDRDLIHPDESIRANGMAYVRHCIDAAHTIGATNLIGPIYTAVGRVWQATPDERERDLELLTAKLRDLAEYAADRGVVLCIEPLNRFETSLINLAAQGVELIDRVDRPGCRLMLDTFHMNIEEQSLGDAIRLAGKRVQHVHACENDRGTPGSGHVPWNDVAAGLRDIGYDGPVVIESFTSKVKSIARAAAIWRPLAASQDALARDGLAFLRGLLA
ncbi:MAG TPA: sugar phosphate isomerase/epimerase family protein [Kouleothrix sp.]|uniref:sugar phosphate isomerase/epimerase family protein n=1 Tax=Kouleothrix sp. TaxID=2779161 RepID=UPI002BA1725B|nr:sugar phosphate isomerase/epimerase family protein [Kouleothrix sp.]HRC76635.1 sugar phosphate isomerase/epimerase family protein [Kouleothrix sp.]